MNSLLIDTSNQPLSVALMQNDEVLAEITTDSKQNHSVQLMPAISQLFEQSKIAKQQLDAIIVAEGPGSYTGLRIGVTVAKTLAYALDVKLYGVSSLKALAATIDHTDKLLVPVFDARRQAVYTGIFQWQNGQLVTILEDQYMSIDALRAFLEDLNQPVISFAVIFINSQVGILLFLMSCLFNIILSATLKRTYEDDLKSIFYASNVLKQGYTISKIKHAPQPEVNFKQFRTARHLTSVLAEVNDEDIGAMVIKLVKLIFMLDYVLFHSIQKSYTTHINELKNCFDYIAELDNHYALAMYRRTLECYTEPQIDDSNDGIVFSELTHPLIADAVANDFSLSQNILLTGSNASGKSTFMKSIAINIILASAIQTVTASKFVYQPGIVFTSMANADDVLSGDSYFMAELKSIKRIVEIPDNQKIYCFIDEIFKGTNTTERIAASESVLSFLHEKSNFRVIAATHDIELAELLKQRYENYHFNEVIENNNIHFDYKIKPGKANTRNAIELLKITSFPAKIYERAKDNVSNG